MNRGYLMNQSKTQQSYPGWPIPPLSLELDVHCREFVYHECHTNDLLFSILIYT